METYIIDCGIRDDRVRLARDWHSGQASMLYAVASTGRLAFSYSAWWEPGYIARKASDLTGQLETELRAITHEAMGDDLTIACEWWGIVEVVASALAAVVDIFDA